MAADIRTETVTVPGEVAIAAYLAEPVGPGPFPAVVVLQEGRAATEADLRDWCRQRLAGFKCPSAVVFVDEREMPRTTTGKVLHRVLRQRFGEG